MANFKLSDKLSILGDDKSDLSDLSVGIWQLSSSVILVTFISWLFTTIMMQLVLHGNTLLISSLTKDTIFSRNNVYFIGIIVGVAIIRSVLYQFSWFKDACGDGASQALNHFKSTYEKLTVRKLLNRTFRHGTFLVAIKRVLVTVMTLGAGGSGGIEGPAIPVGQHVGSGVAKLYQVKDIVWLRILEMCGISAAITTLLHAPLTGAIFSLELVFGCKFVYRLLTISLLSSLVAFILSDYIMAAESLFTLAQHDISYTLFEYFIVVVVTVFASIPSGIGLLFVFSIVRRIYAGLPVIAHAPVGALICALVAILMYHFFDISPHHLLGVGEETISLLFEHAGHDAMYSNWVMLGVVVILKIVLVGFTVVSGGSAGLLVPAMFVGAMSSSALYHLLMMLDWLPVIEGLHALFVVTGVASSLICVLDLPIATVIFVGELFGVSYIPPCIIAVALSRTLTSYIRQRQA
jgi:CIC family chloride channel protein